MPPHKNQPNQRFNNEYEGQSLIYNGGFEDWCRGVGPFAAAGEETASHWILYGGATVSVSAPGYRGVASANIAGPGGILQRYNSWANQSPLAPPGAAALEIEGQYVSFSAYVRTITGGAVRLRIGDYAGAVWGYTDSAFHPGGNVWVRLTVVRSIRTGLQVDPALLAAAAFFVDVGAGATCEVDQATVIMGKYMDGIEYVPGNPSLTHESEGIRWATVGPVPLLLPYLPVAIDPVTGLLVIADATNPVLAGCLVGVALWPGVPGSLIPYRFSGIVVNPSPIPPNWIFTPGAPVFCSVAPTHVQQPPLPGGAPFTWYQQIGTAWQRATVGPVTSNAIQIRIGETVPV